MSSEKTRGQRVVGGTNRKTGLFQTESRSSYLSKIALMAFRKASQFQKETSSSIVHFQKIRGARIASTAFGKASFSVCNVSDLRPTLTGERFQL